MVMLIVLVLGLATVLVKSLSATDIDNKRNMTTAAALAQARDALIGRAISDSNMPGSLPCPDTDDDGSAELLSGNDCPSYIGRLPWRTLKLTDLRDGSGERLWYALSNKFRDDSSAQPLNSNTKGTLPVYSADGTTLLTQAGYSAVAVIFAPGIPVGSQVRGTVAEQNNAANYLDNANSRNNASASGPYIAGIRSETFNDQLLFITTRELVPLIEQRVAGEVKGALTNYYAANGYYPWADNIAWGSDNYRANDKENRGWLPNNASAGDAPDWGAARPPQWFFDNQWYAVIYYSVAEDYTEDPGNCDTCDDNTLTVDGTNGVRTLFLMTGTPINPQQRISTSELGTLSNYMEDPENKDHNDDHYVTPASQAADRDRLYRLPSSSTWKP